MVLDRQDSRKFQMISYSILYSQPNNIIHSSNKRSGAVEARRAHNPDVPGSKPGCASLSFFGALPSRFFLMFKLIFIFSIWSQTYSGIRGASQNSLRIAPAAVYSSISSIDNSGNSLPGAMDTSLMAPNSRSVFT